MHMLHQLRAKRTRHAWEINAKKFALHPCNLFFMYYYHVKRILCTAANKRIRFYIHVHAFYVLKLWFECVFVFLCSLSCQRQCTAGNKLHVAACVKLFSLKIHYQRHKCCHSRVRSPNAEILSWAHVCHHAPQTTTCHSWLIFAFHFYRNFTVPLRNSPSSFHEYSSCLIMRGDFLSSCVGCDDIHAPGKCCETRTHF